MIFISHSSKNNNQAILVRDWLVEQGWGLSQIFLDLANLNPGDRWHQALNSSSSGCEAIIACLSDDWLRSPECLREFNLAESSGNSIFPVLVAPITEHIPRFITDLQIANLADPKFRYAGFEKLKSGLLAARIGPQYFRWPPKDEPDGLPYRGLRPLDTKSELCDERDKHREKKGTAVENAADTYEYLQSLIARGFDLTEAALRVVVYENPFATIPLPRHLFTGPYDQRWGVTASEPTSIAPIFTGQKFQELTAPEAYRNFNKSPLAAMGILKEE